jgi:ATP-binding cassette subfamily B multidrug efflux pump
VRDLVFSYGDGPRILDEVSLELMPGEVVALVGRTGSGKSTMGRVLTRAYGGYEGSVTLDGVELRELELSQVRRVVGSVQQDVQLFAGDVRFNLTLGQEISDERLWECIGLARADEVVDRLGGLDGVIENRGFNVSIGEAQLLSFARTLVADTEVVIMDEATANVDTLTEARIQQATEAVLERKTVLVIAHRLSTIVHADRICVMQAGKVVEMGSHRELLDSGGIYAGLFRQQFE